MIKESVKREREESLRQVLKNLPTPILNTLSRGVREADAFAPGTLLTGDNGGCAVGVLLRALYPWADLPDAKSLKEAKPEMARRIPHLVTLEQVFDRTVQMQARASADSVQESAKKVAHWVGRECERMCEKREEEVAREKQQAREQKLLDQEATRELERLSERTFDEEFASITRHQLPTDSLADLDPETAQC